MSKQYALLIGVDFYYQKSPPPAEGYYPKLKGCVRDINHVEAYLKDVLKLPAGNITKLTISGGTQPLEPASQWPTYQNMVAGFKQLTGVALPGDQLYIHYSGRGGRTKTIYPTLKGADGVDEALVPPDIVDPKSHYLRDVEISYLLQCMVDKGLVVTVVLDSCHSGGATRALIENVPGAVARGPVPADWLDTTPRSEESECGPVEALVASYSRTAGGTARQVKSDSGWLVEPKGYTLLAACRANESANEYPFNGSENNGALTYWLLDTLRHAGREATYKSVQDRILAKVHDQFEQQTPMLEGEGDVRVFGSDRLPSHYAVTVLRVDTAAGRIRLNAGEAHGLQVGTQFAVYPFGTTDFTQPDQRAALAEVTQLRPVDCWAKIVEQRPGAVLEQGAQAVLLNMSHVRLQRGVAVPLQDAALRQKVEAALRDEGKGFVALAGGDLPPDFQVALNASGELELQDPADRKIAGAPTVAATEPDAASVIVQRAVHIVKFKNVLALDTPDTSMKQKLAVSLDGSGNTDRAGGPTFFKPGDRLTLNITNPQQPNPADPNDPRRVLNITVLDLASDWSITQFYPASAGAFEPLDPGKTLPLELEAWLPAGQSEILDKLKVFATRDTTNFRWLELPALGKPDTRSRGQIHDPLEQLLSAITADQASTRHVSLTASPQADGGWTTAEVELRVRASAGGRTL